MHALTDIIENIKTHKSILQTKYGLNTIAIFGSYSHGFENQDSDLDIMVDFDRPIGVEFIDLANELEKILDIKVDLVSKNGIKPEYFQNIKTDLIYV